MALEKTLAIIIVVVIAVTAVVLTLFLARCIMKQSSIGQMEEDKGCKQSAKAWLDENLRIFKRLGGRGGRDEEQTADNIPRVNDIRQQPEDDVDIIHIDEEESSRRNPYPILDKSEVQLAAVPSIIRMSETTEKKILVV